MSQPDVEVLFDGMWIRRVGPDFFPDPEYDPAADPNWPKWLQRAEKFRSDAADYWLYVYKPQPGDVIVDIGAGRGEDVFAFSPAVGSTGQVWALEPHPTSFAALEHLCRLNRLANVVPLNFACTAEPADLQIETLPVWESNFVRTGAPTSSSHPVRGVPFDDIAVKHGIDRIDFLKMNIEGAERDALPGCRNALEHTRHVCVAAHDFRANRGEGEQFRTLTFVREYLTDVGFEVVTGDADPRYYVPYHVHGVRRRNALS